MWTELRLSLCWLTVPCPSLPACRVISRAPGLKLVVETLISSLKPIGNIVLICCAFFIIFGILGVQVRGCPLCGVTRSPAQTIHTHSTAPVFTHLGIRVVLVEPSEGGRPSLG